MKKTIHILITLLSVGLNLPALAAINAWLDHNQISIGETVQLTLQHDGQTDSQPDLSPLKQDFEIVGRSSGSNIQIVNGKMNAQVQVSLMLLPKHDGKLHIPALQWDGQSSSFLPLSVSNSGTAAQSGNASSGNMPSGNASHVFVTAVADQKQPYVQAAVSLTVRLYTDQPLYQASLDLQPNNDVLVQQLGQDRQSRETRNGHSYQVVERKYLLFPQRSGKVLLDGPVLNAQVQDASNSADPFGNMFGRNPFAGMFNSTKPIRIQGDPVALDVRPRPASTNGHDWLPAQNATLEESWQPDNGPIHAGDPVTRHLHLRAEGVSAAQLPDLSPLMQLPSGLRAYPDQPRLSNDAHGNSIIGSRDQDIAIIAGNAGRYEIPALHVFWWDSAKNIQREIVLPARTLDVLPSTGGIAIGTSPPSQDTASGEPPVASSAAKEAGDTTVQGNHWNGTSFTFALLWLGTLAAWWFSSWRNSEKTDISIRPTIPVVPVPGINEARKAFRQACRDNDARSARRHLLDWAHAVWIQNPPGGLMALAERLDNPALETLLKQLDRACYTDGGWQGKALLESLKTLPGIPDSGVFVVPKLAGLYP